MGEPTKVRQLSSVPDDPGLLLALKQQLLTLRGLHLQARAAMLAAQRIVNDMKPTDPRYDDFAAVAYGIAELNIAMGEKQADLLAQIHEAEHSMARLH